MEIKLTNTVKITIPQLVDEVEMTSQEFCKFHDDLTSFYNDNYQALTKD